MANFRAIHTIELKPETDQEEFERFMIEEFLPEVAKLPGCMQIQLLKGYKGELPGVAQSKADYGWITLWESVEANNKVWSHGGEHYNPENIEEVNAKLLRYATNYTLVGGFVVVDTKSG